jgi:hypothetical protein
LSDLLIAQFWCWQEPDLRSSQEDERREVVSSQHDGGYAAAVDAHLPRETPPRLLPRLRIQTIRARRQGSERTTEDSSLEVVQKETVTNGDLAVMELVILTCVRAE